MTKQEAEDARNKNIIEISLDFSAMMRVFSKGSSATILRRLEEGFRAFDGVADKADYDRFHADFCQWFIQNISTAEKKFKSGQTKPSRTCSYGQAAKVLDVAAKVYVYYCGQPSQESARRLVPTLHAALDNRMMEHLGIPTTLQQVDRAAYEYLQSRVADEIAHSQIYPVQYDDILWRRLQRAESR